MKKREIYRLVSKAFKERKAIAKRGTYSLTYVDIEDGAVWCNEYASSGDYTVYSQGCVRLLFAFLDENFPGVRPTVENVTDCIYQYVSAQEGAA